jgi:hypothetical protein
MMAMPWSLPYLAVRREGSLTRIGRSADGQDIDFESDDFNRLYHIQSDDPRYAYGVIHPLMMEWMLGAGKMLVPWCIAGRRLMVADNENEIDSTILIQKLQVMDDLLELIPAYVREDYGTTQ